MFYCYRVAILTKSKYAVAAIAVVRETLLANVLIFLTASSYLSPSLGQL